MLTMSTPASIARHPIHSMLVALPIGLWVFSLVSDFIGLAWESPTWKSVALYTMVGGIIGALLAAIPGFIDWFSLATARVQRLGTTHMVLNLILVALFSSNAWLRLTSTIPDAIPLTLSIVGVLILGVSGWLGGEMVYVHRVGVAPATSNASSRTRQAA
jgi:uncharacterized membrane protein